MDDNSEVAKRFAELKKRYDQYQADQVNEDPQLANVGQMTKDKIMQGTGDIISPEQFREQNIRMRSPPPPVPPPYQGRVAPTSETSPESQAGYKRAMDMIAQRQKDKQMDQYLGQSPEQRMNQQAMDAKAKALQDMEQGTDWKRMSDEFSENPPTPQPIPETPEQKMRRAMYGSK